MAAITVPDGMGLSKRVPASDVARPRHSRGGAPLCPRLPICFASDSAVESWASNPSIRSRHRRGANRADVAAPHRRRSGIRVVSRSRDAAPALAEPHAAIQQGPRRAAAASVRPRARARGCVGMRPPTDQDFSSALLLASISTRLSDQDVEENGDTQGQEHR